MKLLDLLLSLFSLILRKLTATYNHFFNRRPLNFSQIHQWFLYIDKKYGVKNGGIFYVFTTSFLSFTIGVITLGYPSAPIFILQLAILVKSLSKKAGMSHDLSSASRFLPEISIFFVRVWGYICLTFPAFLQFLVRFYSDLSLEAILASVLSIYLSSFYSRHLLYHVMHKLIKRKSSVKNHMKWDTIAKLIVFRRFYFNPVIQIRNWMLLIIIVLMIINLSIFDNVPILEYYVRNYFPVLYHWHLFLKDPLIVSILILVITITAEGMVWLYRIIRDVYLNRIQSRIENK